MSDRPSTTHPSEAVQPSAFLRGGGEMGDRIRQHDWSSNPLGHPDGWPAALRTAVRIMLTTNHPMFIFWGVQGRCLYNDAYRRSLGPEKHPSILGVAAKEAWAEIWPIIGPQIDQVMAGRDATWHENQLVPIIRNGRLEEVYWTYSYGPIDDDSAPTGVGGVLVVCTETTTQVVSERTLRAADARWRELFDQTPSFVCVLEGPEFRYEYANRHYLELVGQSDVIGKTVLEILPEVEEQGFLDLLKNVYQTGDAYVAREAPFVLRTHRDPAARMRHIDFVYQPIRGWRGEITGIFVEGSDVSDRVRVAGMLEEASRRKDEFLATLAHELRNPLAPIRNAAMILNAPKIDPGRSAWAAKVIDRQVHAMSRLLDDLLDISRIARGHITLAKQLVTVEAIVETALEVGQPAISAKNHRVNVDVPDDLMVEADPLRLSQALSNLLINAAKYTDAQGDIALAAWTDSEQLHFSVKDSGIGLARESLAGVFDMFSQVRSGVDRSEGGLGIGLALVKAIVELHGGTVGAHSQGLGEGSEFRIRMPLRQAEQ